ncbi:MAG: hypothetical protein K2W95_19435 [Candidatus Obscuribacterales bacterium]|nr:hypothetical protein [Candidatus Obscuribacterales bacterium]
MDKKRAIDSLAIDLPCPIPWTHMKGDDKIRHCDVCDLNVHNLSAMTEYEIGDFLAANAGVRVCVNMFKRPDGTIVTDRCPAGLRELRNRAKKLYRAVAGFAAFAIASAGPVLSQQKNTVGEKPETTAQSQNSPEWQAALSSFRQGKMDAAICRFKTLAQNDSSGKANYYLGLSLQAKKDYAGAKAQYLQVQKRSGDPHLKRSAASGLKQVSQLMLNETRAAEGRPSRPPDVPMAGGMAPPPLLDPATNAPSSPTSKESPGPVKSDESKPSK